MHDREKRAALVLQRIRNDIKRYGFAILLVAVFYFLMHFVFHAFCPVVVLTGFPCPGCGLSRSILFLFTGQVRRSFSIHPLGIVVVCTFLYCAWFRYVRGRKAPGLKWLLWGLFVAAFLLYIIRMKLYFPTRPPYTYTHGNFLEKMLPHYGFWK